ncbi:unnamed protein product [Acanthosepion pharaonis]|uniref:Uncharacterized protein n=1 Tax=Acanthosepion pharaonis TaxID=158019 RepID=A0A812DBZ5_ACAPH|nr:unnamed protein product [Sepia pharaonis]
MFIFCFLSPFHFVLLGKMQLLLFLLFSTYPLSQPSVNLLFLLFSTYPLSQPSVNLLFLLFSTYPLSQPSVNLLFHLFSTYPLSLSLHLSAFSESAFPSLSTYPLSQPSVNLLFHLLFSSLHLFLLFSAFSQPSVNLLFLLFSLSLSLHESAFPSLLYLTSLSQPSVNLLFFLFSTYPLSQPSVNLFFLLFSTYPLFQPSVNLLFLLFSTYPLSQPSVNLLFLLFSTYPLSQPSVNLLFLLFSTYPLSQPSVNLFFLPCLCFLPWIWTVELSFFISVEQTQTLLYLNSFLLLYSLFLHVNIHLQKHHHDDLCYHILPELTPEEMSEAEKQRSQENLDKDTHCYLAWKMDWKFREILNKKTPNYLQHLKTLPSYDATDSIYQRTKWSHCSMHPPQIHNFFKKLKGVAENPDCKSDGISDTDSIRTEDFESRFTELLVPAPSIGSESQETIVADVGDGAETDDHNDITITKEELLKSMSIEKPPAASIEHSDLHKWLTPDSEKQR